VTGYHFVPAAYGLENIRKRRLKISTIPDLNDPFEFLCVDLSHEELRRGMRAWKLEVGRRFGMLCFSKTWRNPVQWSHYADRHRGVALGLEIGSDLAESVIYDEQRSVAEAKRILAGRADEATMKKFLLTKYAHWHYEQELRVFARLNERDPASGMYFFDFSSDLRLSEVIVGPECELTRAEITEALGELGGSVSLRNARLAFKTYRVTTQNDASLWK
jgi:hypothetical protein